MAEPQAAARVDEQRFRRATGRRFVGLSGGATATPTGTSTRSENAAQTQQRGQAEGEEYTFVQLADTQFGMMAQSKSVQWYLQLRQLVYLATCGRNDGKALIPVPEMRAALKDADDEALLELEIELARKAVKIINRLQPKPRFAVVCGDLTNAFPDKKPAQQDKEVAVFKQIFSQLDPEIELVCVCGNHDVGQKPTPQTIERYKDRFGDDYFSFRVGPDRFVVLNSQLYVDSSQCREAAEAQDMWLDTELFDKKPQTLRHSIAFSHVPPFVWQPDEHHAGFNMPQAARMKLLSRLAQAGFSHIFCGHYHRNAGGIFQRKHLGPIEVVTTTAIGGNIGTDPDADELAFEGMKSIDVSDRLSGMRIVHVGPNGVHHEFRTLRELRDEYREARDAWTSNEDATILKMREAGGKWEDIASALTNQQQGAGSERARSASLVKHRFRKLAAQAS